MIDHPASAAGLDATDPLAEFRDRFAFPDPHLVYLDGNSLGRLPHAAAQRARHLVETEWGDRLIRSWNESWWETPLRIGDDLARVVGAAPGEVAVADSTSVNLFKLAVGALRLRTGRRRILTDDLNFPSDGYVLEGAADLLGGRHVVERVVSPDGIHGPAEELTDRLDDDVALVSLSHVTYASGYCYDLAAVTAAAHRVGAMVLWDLSHSVGVVPADLAAAGADLAVGCTYKHLSGGPGAPAFLAVRTDLQPQVGNPITGWWGHDRPFAFDPAYAPAAGMRRYLTGTAPMLSLAMVGPGVELVLEAGLDRIRAKSVAMTEYLVARWRRDLAPLGFRLNSPTDPARRGSHVSLGHDEALEIDLALIHDFGVLPDFRPPDNLRLGIAPLSTRFADLATAVDALVAIVTEGRQRRYAGSAPTVT